MFSWWQLSINILLWPFIHIAVSMCAFRRELHSFDPNSFLFRERSWEQGGNFYRRFLKIKSWKARLPEGSRILGFGFNKSTLKEKSRAYLDQYHRETCRGEWAHWITLSAVSLFFIWNPLWAKCVMLIYALTLNLPCIIVQRYNRLMLSRILKRDWKS